MGAKIKKRSESSKFSHVILCHDVKDYFLMPSSTAFSNSSLVQGERKQTFLRNKVNPLLYTKGTVPFVYFFAKKVEEMFGGFGYFLYLCSVNKGESKSACSDPHPPNLGGLEEKAGAATQCSWPNEVSHHEKH